MTNAEARRAYETARRGRLAAAIAADPAGDTPDYPARAAALRHPSYAMPCPAEVRRRRWAAVAESERQRVRDERRGGHP